MAKATAENREADKLRKIANTITPMLSPGHGFLLMTFDFGEDGVGDKMVCVSNVDHDASIKLVKKWLVNS